MPMNTLRSYLQFDADDNPPPAHHDSERETLRAENARLRKLNTQLMAKARGEPVILHGDETPETLALLLIDHTPLSNEDINSGLQLAVQLAETENERLRALEARIIQLAHIIGEPTDNAETAMRVITGAIARTLYCSVEQVMEVEAARDKARAELDIVNAFLKTALPTVTAHNKLLWHIEALRQIPNYASIQLREDGDCKYAVHIDESDVGGERLLSVCGEDLLATLQETHARYLLFNREYANKLKRGDSDE